jgi:hypothetical protein
MMILIIQASHDSNPKSKTSPDAKAKAPLVPASQRTELQRRNMELNIDSLVGKKQIMGSQGAFDAAKVRLFDSLVGKKQIMGSQGAFVYAAKVRLIECICNVVHM